MTAKIIDGQRRYGNFPTVPENPTCCVEELGRINKDWGTYQCSRKRGHGPDGLYCKQHAKKHNMEAQ